MDCRQTQRMIQSYINKELEFNELEAFIGHVKNCSECYEELKIYYTIESSLRQLDGDYSQLGNLDSRLEEGVRYTEGRLKRHHRFKVFCYAVNTLAFWSVIYSMALTIRLLLTG